MTIRCWDQDPAQRPNMTEVVELLRESLVSPLSIEADLEVFFHECETWDKDDQEEMARRFAHRLEEVRILKGAALSSLNTGLGS